MQVLWVDLAHANGGLIEIAVFSQPSLLNADIKQSFTVSHNLVYAPAD